MRVVDLLVVAKDENGVVDKIEMTDVDELTELGAVAGALMGFGAAGEEGMEVGALPAPRPPSKEARCTTTPTSGTSPTRSRPA